MTSGFCAECLFDGEYYKCQNCRTDMLYSNAEQYVYHKPKEELCADCKVIWRHRCKRCRVKEVVVRARDLRKNPQKTQQDFPYCRQCIIERNEKNSIKCATCGKEFFVSLGRIEDLREQGKTPPKFCQDCWNVETIVGYCKNCDRPISFKRAKLYELKRQNKIIFDVGHQSYTQKIITGRYNSFNTLRKYKGLSGFQKRNEKISVQCKSCGKEIIYTKGRIEDLRVQGKIPSEYCQECWNEKIPVGACKICGRTIYYSRAKLNQLRERYGSDYSPPKKCENCK